MRSHALVTGTEVVREIGRRRGALLPIAPVVFQSTLRLDGALGDEVPDFAGALGFVELSDFVQHLRTPQVALEMRLYELRGELVTGFSVVEELFPDGLIDALVHDVVSRARTLAAGAGWDDVPALPSATEPGDDRGLAASAGAGLIPPTEQPGPPRDRGEHEVAQVWAEILDVTAPDRATPFAALGGDSLLAVRMLARLATRTGVRIPLLVFLAAPTVAGLARAVTSLMSE